MFVFFQASPAFQHLSAMLVALNLPPAAEQSSVFDLLSDIEKKVIDFIFINVKGAVAIP